jgi:hypothetical protein
MSTPTYFQGGGASPRRITPERARSNLEHRALRHRADAFGEFREQAMAAVGKYFGDTRGIKAYAMAVAEYHVEDRLAKLECIQGGVDRKFEAGHSLYAVPCADCLGLDSATAGLELDRTQSQCAFHLAADEDVAGEVR